MHFKNLQMDGSVILPLQCSFMKSSADSLVIGFTTPSIKQYLTFVHVSNNVTGSRDFNFHPLLSVKINIFSHYWTEGTLWGFEDLIPLYFSE